MNNRLLVFYDDDDFDDLKSFFKENYESNLTNELCQEINIKIDYISYKVYILHIGSDEVDNAKLDIGSLNFMQNELYGFNLGDSFYASIIYECFEKFKDEDGYINVSDFKELDLKNLRSKDKIVKNEELLDAKKSLINSERIKNNNLVHLILIGSFSSGKTTFINILNNILVNNYNEKDMWLPSFAQETTLGIFKISYQTSLDEIVFEDEKGNKINIDDFPIGKGKKILEQHRNYFRNNKVINIIYPLKNEYKNSIFENLIIVDTPGVESVNKTFEKIKLYLNDLNPKGYLQIIRSSMIDKSYSDVNGDINFSFKSLIKQILPENEEEYFFDIFLNDDYLSQILLNSSSDISYNFKTAINLKNLIFINSRLFSMSEKVLSINLSDMVNYLSEEKIIITLLEAIYNKILVIEEYKKLKNKTNLLIQKKENELLPIEKLLKELNIYSNIKFNLIDFLIQLNRIFFNTIRNNYENEIITKVINKNDIFIIINALDTFLKDIFGRQVDVFEEFDKNRLAPLKAVLEVIEAIKQNFFEYYMVLENSIITKYKIIVLDLLNNLMNFDYTDYPSFNDESEFYLKQSINNNIEFKNLIHEFNTIIERKENELIIIKQQLEKLTCKDEVKSLNNKFYKISNM